MTFILRYMIDQNIVGAGWIGVKSKEYRIVPDHQKTSICSLEIIAQHDMVYGIPTHELEAIAPLRILSFDIECMCTLGFPKAERDSVIQISNVLYIQGSEHNADGTEKEKKAGDDEGETDLYFHKNVFCLKSCSPIAGCHVYSYDTEE